ncbi:MAG TPA: YdcF family protein [Actinomycetes bacterium]|nr:YdcF family protein [Actinomycetes bacterium]
MRRVLLGLLALVLAYFAVTTTLVARWMGKDERPKVDAIVVLGAAQYDGRPSAIYQARLEHAVDLYSGGVAPLLVFTGGKEPGDRFTEGGSGARWARERGVPASDVLAEEHSRTTYQNLAGAKKALQRRNPAGGRPRIVVVSDPFHMFRAVKQAADLGMDAFPSPTRTSPLSASRLKLTELVLREDLAIAGYLLSGAGK